MDISSTLSSLTILLDRSQISLVKQILPIQIGRHQINLVIDTQVSYAITNIFNCHIFAIRRWTLNIVRSRKSSHLDCLCIDSLKQ